MQVHVTGTFITGTVKTVSGIYTWEFKVDFNDFGVITGKYWWVYCENDDSTIPDAFIKKMVQLIHEENEKKNSIQTDGSKSLEEVFETFTEGQKSMVMILAGAAKNNIKDSEKARNYIDSLNLSAEINGRTVEEVFNSLTELQKQAVYTIIGEKMDIFIE